MKSINLFENLQKRAYKLDSEDPLGSLRDNFFIPQKDGNPFIYLSGNSLGLQPKSTKDIIHEELQKWAKIGVEGHFEGARPWLSFHSLFSRPLANLTGALPSEIICMNSLTTNMHLLFTSFYQPEIGKADIITEPEIFPSDKYAMDSQLNLHQEKKGVLHYPETDSNGIITLYNWKKVIDKHKNTSSLLWISGVNYLTGQAYPLGELSEYAKKNGLIVGLDLAHAIGNINLQLHQWEVDFAVWCSYKYLNSGPGGVGGAYIHEKHHKSSLKRLEGWWSNKESSRFEMSSSIDRYETAESWQLSNAPILSMAAHLASLNIFEEVGFEAIQKKNQKLKNFSQEVLETLCENNSNLALLSPGPNNRGAQLSLFLKNGQKGIIQKLREKGVIADWRNFREGGLIRIAPTPLYNTFQEVVNFADILNTLFNEKH